MIEYYLAKADYCGNKAHEYYKQGEFLLALFYRNAEEGFKLKALKLDITCKTKKKKGQITKSSQNCRIITY